MIESIASIAMYAGAPEVDAAHAALWAGIRDRLRVAGLADVPEHLDRGDPAAAWLDPGLILAQTCGMPLVKGLAGRVRLVAAPIYGFPGGEGAMRRSFVVVAAASPVTGIADLRGARAAINGHDSNSGANLLRAAVAPYARDGRFFAEVVETGSHRASLARVAAGTAEVAAIDSVTFALAARWSPADVAGVRILAETAATPWLPLVTRADLPEDAFTTLREAVAEAFAEPGLDAARAALGITGLAFPTLADYDRILEVEAEAARLGYPELA